MRTVPCSRIRLTTFRFEEVIELVDVMKQVYTMDEVEELKAEFMSHEQRHNDGLPVQFIRQLMVCHCLNLLGIEWNREIGMFNESESGGVDWIDLHSTKTADQVSHVIYRGE